MRVGRWGKHGVFAAAAALCITSFFTSHAAFAHVRHHRWYHDDTAPITDLGPTSPGVSFIVINASTGDVLSENGADIPRYPASLTKLMVLDLAFQALADGRMTLNTLLPVSEHAASVEPVKLGLVPGEKITVRQAILAMTTMSANDAATVLGEYLGGGSEYRCAQMMTLRAHALGMAQTQFYNASGLPDPGQVTTARDLAILARDIVLDFPQDQPFFETLKFDFNGRTIYSNDEMLKLYPGTMGMKTGYTDLARHNLITAAERDGTILIGVELHENSWGDSYTQMASLLDTGFRSQVGGGNTVLASRQTAPPQASALTPPSIPLPPRSETASLFPPAEAATLHPVLGKSGEHDARHPQPVRLAGDDSVTRDLIPGWTAQVGSYSRMKSARRQAITVHEMRGVGIARIARDDDHGRVLWAAQLAGLSWSDAHATCQALAARGDSCFVLDPQSDHLAMRDTSAG